MPTRPSVEDGCRYPGFEQLGELVRKYGAAEIVSLNFVTVVSLKKRQLFLRFDTLGDDPQLEASSHADHRGHDGGLVGSGGDLADERLVDLEGVDRKLSQIAQAGVARPEVVDRQLHPFRSQRV